MNEIVTGQCLEYIYFAEGYYNLKFNIEFQNFYILLTGLKKDIYHKVYQLSADEYMRIYISSKETISRYMDEHNYKYEIFLYLYFNTKQICVMFNSGDHSDSDIEECGKFINELLQQTYEKEIFHGEKKYFNFTTITPILKKYEEITPAFNRLLEIQKLSFFQNQSMVLTDERLSELQKTVSYSQIQKMISEVKDYMEMGQVQLSQEFIKEIFFNYLKNAYDFERCNEVLLALKGLVYRYNNMYDLDLEHEVDNVFILYKYRNIEELYSTINEVLLKCANAVVLNGNGMGYISQKTIKFIKCNYHKDISLTDIAAQININSTYLSDIFNKEVGISIPQYLNRLRIEKSKSLLKNHNIKIGEVSALVGFQDSNYFGKVFKKNVGMTPERFRENGM
jgi:two-component system response regulator YesN